eukprot:Nk52_evm1s217 gene=Nk52_evmTU1s217
MSGGKAGTSQKGSDTNDVGPASNAIGGGIATSSGGRPGSPKASTEPRSKCGSPKRLELTSKQGGEKGNNNELLESAQTWLNTTKKPGKKTQELVMQLMAALEAQSGSSDKTETLTEGDDEEPEKSKEAEKEGTEEGGDKRDGGLKRKRPTSPILRDSSMTNPQFGQTGYARPDLPLAPSFDGDEKSEVEDYIMCFNSWAEAAQGAGLNQCIIMAHFIMGLSGKAATWFRGLNPKPQSWAIIEPMLRARFADPDPVTSAKERLYGENKLSQTGTVRQLADEVEDICSKLQGASDAMKRDVFTFALKQPLKEKVVAKSFRTYAEAYNHAATLENIQSTGKQNGPPGGALRVLREEKPGKLTEEEREKLMEAKACFRCRQPGHLARNCTGLAQGN